MYQAQSLNSIPNLRPYQRSDIEFLKKQNCAACFNEPRTGKTPTALYAFVERNITKFLVVCPNSALYQWQNEVKRWTGLSAIIAAGTPAKKKAALANWVDGALIISYDSLKTTQKSDGLINQVLLKQPQGVILDEAHRIKNPKSANAAAAFQLARKIEYRIALTGTPAPNKPQEVWSILHFLSPKEFSSYWRFIDDYFYTKDIHLAGHSYKDIICVRQDRIKDLQNILARFATQRKRRTVMQWLPEKDRQPILLEPTKHQKRYLEELACFFETEDVVTTGTLDRLIRYRQICLHPGLLNLKGNSPKIDWIKQYLADYPDRPTIIFSKFTSFLHLLSEELKDTPHALIVGATTIIARNEAVIAFQARKNKLLLINLDAGKEALTLDTAEAIIFTDKYPPVGDIEQAEDRFVATVEEKADKAHIIYELIMKDTYDEAIYKLIKQRAEAIDVINNFKEYLKDNYHGRV